MKITINIDCTPQEARTFLGLPDVEPLQKEFMRQMKEKMTSGLTTEDMDKMMKMWTPMAGQGWDQINKMFWAAATGKTSDENK